MLNLQQRLNPILIGSTVGKQNRHLWWLIAVHSRVSLCDLAALYSRKSVLFGVLFTETYSALLAYSRQLRCPGRSALAHHGWCHGGWPFTWTGMAVAYAIHVCDIFLSEAPHPTLNLPKTRHTRHFSVTNQSRLVHLQWKYIWHTRYLTRSDFGLQSNIVCGPFRVVHPFCVVDILCILTWNLLAWYENYRIYGKVSKLKNYFQWWRIVFCYTRRIRLHTQVVCEFDISSKATYNSAILAAYSAVIGSCSCCANENYWCIWLTELF